MSTTTCSKHPVSIPPSLSKMSFLPNVNSILSELWKKFLETLKNVLHVRVKFHIGWKSLISQDCSLFLQLLNIFRFDDRSWLPRNNPKQTIDYITQNTYITRMHSSRMRTARSLTVSHCFRKNWKNSPIKGWGGLSKMSNKMSKMSIIELSRLGPDLFDFSGLTWAHPLTHPSTHR